MIRSLRHFGIVVRDLEQAINFYSGVLGLRVVRRMEEAGPFLDTILNKPGVRVSTVKLGAFKGPTLLELLYFTTPKAASSPCPSLFRSGLSHFALTVENLALLHRNLLEKETKILSAPSRSPDGLALVCFARDPEGNLIELVEELKS